MGSALFCLLSARLVESLLSFTHGSAVHRVSDLLVKQGANILEVAHFDDVGTNRFFMRVQFEANDTSLSAASLADRFASVASELVMQANFYAMATRVRALIIVSKQGHCANDLLFRNKNGGEAAPHRSGRQMACRASRIG